MAGFCVMTTNRSGNFGKVLYIKLGEIGANHPNVLFKLIGINKFSY